jgi:hypothetical protein
LRITDVPGSAPVITLQTTKENGMSEIEQLKRRIDSSGPEGVKTKHVRDDYEPAGDMLMQQLMESGEYVQRRDPDWKIFRKDMAPF